MTAMSDSPPEPLAYEPPESQAVDCAWRLLRLAVTLWASLVLLRHATYWGATYWGAVFVGKEFAFLTPMIGAAFESCVLVAMLLIAVTSRVPTPSAARWLRILGIAFVTLVLIDFAWREGMPASWMDLRQVLRFLWQLASRAQLLVVPILCIAYPRLVAGRR